MHLLSRCPTSGLEFSNPKCFDFRGYYFCLILFHTGVSVLASCKYIRCKFLRSAFGSVAVPTRDNSLRIV